MQISLFLCFYLAGENYRKKIIGEEFNKAVQKKIRIDVNTLVGCMNVEEGVEKARKSEATPEVTIKQELIEIDNVNAIRCFYCNKLGHKKVDCFQYKQAQKNSRGKMNRRPHTERNPNSTPNSCNAVKAVDLTDFYVTVTIYNHMFQALIDTGAAVSLVSSEVVEAINKIKNLKKSDKALVSADGSKMEIKGLIKLDVEICEKVFKWDFVVAEKLAHQIIVGLDLLRSHFSSISLLNNSLVVSNINTSNKEIIFQKYPRMFNFKKKDYGMINVTVPRRVEVKEEFNIYTPAYQYNEQMRNIIKDKIKELMESEIIEKVDLNYSSPIVMIPKKDKSFRMCVNYIKLNKITIKMNYTFTNLNILREKMNKCKFFSKLDMSDGYHQVVLQEKDVNFTAFSCHLGTYIYKKLPFGLTNAPVIFQKIMDTILFDAQDFALANLDDTIIFSKDLASHKLHVKTILRKFDSYNIKLNKEKCVFYANEIEYCGMEFLEDQVKISKKKLIKFIGSRHHNVQRNYNKF